jgi:hypothetical protein
VTYDTQSGKGARWNAQDSASIAAAEGRRGAFTTRGLVAIPAPARRHNQRGEALVREDARRVWQRRAAARDLLASVKSWRWARSAKAS